MVFTAEGTDSVNAKGDQQFMSLHFHPDSSPRYQPNLIPSCFSSSSSAIPLAQVQAISSSRNSFLPLSRFLALPTLFCFSLKELEKQRNPSCHTHFYPNSDNPGPPCKSVSIHDYDNHGETNFEVQSIFWLTEMLLVLSGDVLLLRSCGFCRVLSSLPFL
ncbi:unnamed protein product [Calypogeia fissa]